MRKKTKIIILLSGMAASGKSTIAKEFLFATKDDNYTAKALKEKCGTSEVYKATKALPFSSE